MDELNARNMIRFSEWGRSPALELPEPEKRVRGAHLTMDKKTFVRRYGIAIIAAALFTLYSVLLSAYVDYKTEKRVREECAVEYAAMLEAHKEEQAQAQAAEYFLSGEASREAFFNQEIDAVAVVIAKLNTDAQKASEAACMIARHMNPAYPNSFKEIAEQPQQWPLYDGKDKTFSTHDREIASHADRIVEIRDGVLSEDSRMEIRDAVLSESRNAESSDGVLSEDSSADDRSFEEPGGGDAE